MLTRLLQVVLLYSALVYSRPVDTNTVSPSSTADMFSGQDVFVPVATSTAFPRNVPMRNDHPLGKQGIVSVSSLSSYGQGQALG